MIQNEHYNRACDCDDCTGVVTTRRVQPGLSYTMEINGRRYTVLRAPHGTGVLAVYRLTWTGRQKEIKAADWPPGLTA